jgi:hypothetical protein
VITVDRNVFGFSVLACCSGYSLTGFVIVIGFSKYKLQWNPHCSRFRVFCHLIFAYLEYNFGGKLPLILSSV